MRAILANPDEDTPRLAFADWPDEHGEGHDRARAVFIRLQVGHAQEHGTAPEPEPDAQQKAERLKPLAPLVGKVITYPPTDIAWSRVMRSFAWVSGAGC